MTSTPRPDRIALGITLVLLSTLLTSSQDAVIKAASGDLTLWQIYVLRSALLIPAFLLIARHWGEGRGSLSRALSLWPLTRSVLFLGMNIGIYGAIPFLPLSAIAAGIYTAPLFVALLSVTVLGEPVRPLALLAILSGFAGVLMVLKPGSETFSWQMLLPVAGGLSYALSGLVTRSHCREIAPPTLALSFNLTLGATGLIGCLTLLALPLDPDQIAATPFLLRAWGPLTATSAAIIAILATFMLANGPILAQAYQVAPTAVIVTFDYCYLIFATLFGVIFFGERPDSLALLGITLIIAAGLLVTRANPAPQ